MKKKLYTVFIDGELTKITKEEFANYNVITTKSNGYSHSFLVVEKLDYEKHFYSESSPIFNNMTFNYFPTHLTKSQKLGFMRGSSEVSFS